MNGTDVNAVLSFVVVTGAAMALAVWISPKALDWLTARLRARSCALAAGRASYRAAYAATLKANRG
jgi:hypothetical protein